MIRAIIHARKLIEHQVKQNSYDYISVDFKKYQKGYYWSNENIACYLGIVDIRNKENALCVAGTGDHIFNLLSKGIKNIDSFDINRLTEYYALGLKRAMILKYEYFDFKYMMEVIASPGLTLDLLSDILRDLLPYMDDNHRIFWREIIDFNYRIQKKHGTNLNLIQMLYIEVYQPRQHIDNNLYLTDEYCFAHLKMRLRTANITFKGIDALDLAKHYKGKQYDLILLSNILDYANTRWGDNWDYQRLEEYLSSLESLSKKDSVIFYKYILSYMKDNEVKDKLFHDSKVQPSDITDRMYTIPKCTTSLECDAIILRRVNHTSPKIN